MRILLCSRNFFPGKGVVGGAQVSILHMAKHWLALGHDVAVLSIDDHEHIGVHPDTGIFEYRLRLQNLYVRGQHGGLARVGWHLVDRMGQRMDAKYLGVLEDYRPDVMMTHVLAGLNVGIWRAAKRAGVPVVHMVHDYYLLCEKSSMRRAGHNCTTVCVSCKLLACKTSRPAAEVVTDVIYVSDHVQQAHETQRIFPALTKAHIVHGSYPLPRPEARRRRARADKITLGYFGRLSPEKGVVELIEALRAIPSHRWALKIGGGGEPEYVEALKSAATSLDIELLGIVSPDSFYSNVDAVIISSLWNDPAPRVAYEAGIHGVLPIVAKRGGLPQLVDYGGRGLIYDPAEPDSLTSQLMRIINERQLIEQFKARWLVDQRIFDPVVVGDSILGILASAQNRS